MDETRTRRDLPVLTAIVEVFERTGRVMRPNEIVGQSGLDADQVETALRALEGEDPPFITKLERRASGGISLVGKPTGHARRAVGAWTTPESIADRLFSALDQAADREPDLSLFFCLVREFRALDGLEDGLLVGEDRWGRRSASCR
ncbi:MAG: hypothetical protein V9F00_14555 [Nocardioides sp.]